MAATLVRSNTAIHRPIPSPSLSTAQSCITGNNATSREPPENNYDGPWGRAGTHDRQDPAPPVAAAVISVPASATAQPNNSNTPTRIRPTVRVPQADPKPKMDSPAGFQTPALDPISRQILERTSSLPHRLPGSQHGSPASHGATARPDEPKVLGRQQTGLTETDSLRRSDSLLSTKGPEKKKKGFLSRILGNKSKDSLDTNDNASEIMDNRDAGNNAEVFSHPIGFVPKFPAPPRYIRVKAQNRKKRDLDRLFLAQMLLEGAPRSRKASEDFDARIRDINDHPAPEPHNSTRTRNNAVWAAEFSKDGQYYAAGGQDKKLRVWRVLSSKQDREASDDEEGQNVKLNAPVFKQELVREYEGHSAAILDLSWSKNNFLLSSSMDKTVRLYHISRPECLCAFKHNDFVTSISFHPRDDRFFLAGSLDSKIRLWSIPDKNIAYWTQVHDMVTAVAFTPDGKTAIAGTLSGLCTLYDTEGLKAHSQIHVRSARGKNSKGSKITGIETLSVSRPNAQPDVKLLITSNDSRVRLYNLRDRSLEAKFRGHENSTSQIRATFSDDGKYVICGSEDKRVYVWPTGPLERQDSDKRPVEVFEAHSAIVTTALLLPSKSRVSLARSGDPIYDLCNPPPVRLLSRTDSMLSSQAPTDISDSAPDKPKDTDSSTSPANESPQYAARHVHRGGLILVTGDYTGEIKVFRQDCAFQKRKDSQWDSGSFSRKILARSASVTTKASERSSIYRKSMNFAEPRSPASRDKILDWQNSVMSAKSVSATTSSSEIIPDSHRSSMHTDRDRSASPGGFRRGFAHRFSLRHGSTPLANSTRVSTEDPQRLATPDATRFDGQRLSDVTVTGNASPYYSAAGSVRRRSSPVGLPESSQGRKNLQQKFVDAAIPDISLTNASPTLDDNEDDPYDNRLFLVDDQSYMAYDIKHNLVPMARASPRTPGPNMVPNPLGRESSFVSSLSSERNSSTASTPFEETAGTGLGLGINHEHQDASASASEGTKSDAEELKCKRCGNETFAMVKHRGKNGESGLKCRQCGAMQDN